MLDESSARANRGRNLYPAPARGEGHDFAVLYQPPRGGSIPGTGYPWRFLLRVYRRRDSHLIGLIAPRCANVGNDIADVSRYLLPALVRRYCGGERPTCWVEEHPCADPGQRYRLVRYATYAGGRLGRASWESVAPDVVAGLLEDPLLADGGSTLEGSLHLPGPAEAIAPLWWDVGHLISPAEQHARAPGLHDDPTGQPRWRLKWALGRWRRAERAHLAGADSTDRAWEHERAIRAALPALDAATTMGTLVDHFLDDRLRPGWLDEPDRTIGDLLDLGAAHYPGTVEYWATRAALSGAGANPVGLCASRIIDSTFWRHLRLLQHRNGSGVYPLSDSALGYDH